MAEDRADAVRRIAGLTRDFDAIVASVDGANADDEHDPEGQTIGFERAQVSALLAEAEARIAQLDRALARIRDRSAGRCESCGRPIAIARLLATPTTIACIDCATAAGATRRHSR